MSNTLLVPSVNIVSQYFNILQNDDCECTFYPCDLFILWLEICTSQSLPISLTPSTLSFLAATCLPFYSQCLLVYYCFGYVCSFFFEF